MLGPFIDTIVICTMTGLVIVVTGAWHESSSELTGAALTAHAFKGALGGPGELIVGVGLALFAYSTIIAWSYYGDRSAHYLFGERAVLPYRIFYTLLVIVGAAVPLQLVWNIADITNGEYFHANDRQELEAIYTHLDDINPRHVDTQSYRPPTDVYR